MHILTDCRNRLKTGGIVILDAHRTWWDILQTARYIRKELNPREIIMPIAGYIQFIPVAKQAVSWFSNRYSINFIPVYRRDEYAPVNIAMKLLCMFYPKSLSRETRELANTDYVQQTLVASSSPGIVIIVAPYGSPLWFGNKVKYGVRKLLERDSPRYLSQSRWHWKSLKLKTTLIVHDRDLLDGYWRLTRSD